MEILGFGTSIWDFNAFVSFWYQNNVSLKNELRSILCVLEEFAFP